MSWTDVAKKSCQVFKASFVRHLSAVNDWHVFLPFSPPAFLSLSFKEERKKKSSITCAHSKKNKKMDVTAEK